MRIGSVRNYTGNSYIKTAKLYKKNYPQEFNYNSIYDRGFKIPFTGYILNNDKKPDFDETVNENWFQLPSKKNIDGKSQVFYPDDIQLECARALYKGDSVLLIAPTGVGKTAVANWVITNNLSENQKTVYTTPLIALANDKYREFSKIWGEDKVGLLTGEKKLNANAPVVIMTTEIYNNQVSGLYDNSNPPKTVVFDEGHYLSDKERGTVWENAIINTPSNKTQMLILSATIGNGKSIAGWISSLNNDGKISLFEQSNNERHVPLVWYIYNTDKNQAGNDKFLPLVSSEINLNKINPLSLTDKQKRAMEIVFNSIKSDNRFDLNECSKTAQKFLETFWEGDEVPSGEKIENFKKEDFVQILKIIYPNLKDNESKEIAELLSDNETSEIIPYYFPYDKTSSYSKLIEDLREKDMLPCLIFKLSKKTCQNVVENLKDNNIDLTTDNEKEEIERIINEYQKEQYLGRSFDKKALLSGYAYHHAGELPAYKKLIEELFSKKLLKVVSATSTLSAGINMPARTVVISDTTYRKYDGDIQDIAVEKISANEFHQMAGRAGRRGIDTIGNVVLYNLSTKKTGETDKESELELAYRLLKSGADNIRSNYRPDWCMCIQYSDNFEKIADKSFKIYSSKNPEKEKKSLLKAFARYKKTLFDLAYIDNTPSITPKGELLRLSQGTYPLMLSGLIYDKKIKEDDILGLCQLAGFIAGADNVDLDIDNEKFIFNTLKEKIPNSIEYIQSFKDREKYFSNYEKNILRILNQNQIPKNQITYSNIYGSYCTYLWALLNSKNSDYINNFKILTKQKENSKNQNFVDKNQTMIDNYNLYMQEGRVYKTIAKATSTLKRILAISEYIINNEEKFDDINYYKKLNNTALKALELMYKPPLNDEFDE